MSTLIRQAGLLALLGVAGCSAPTSTDPDPAEASAPDRFAITGTNVVPMDGEYVLRDHTIIVADGLITAMGKADSISVPAHMPQEDGSGRYVLPGLFDLHIHAQTEDDLFLYLASGVTTVLNLHGSDVDLVRQAGIGAGQAMGLRYFSCGPPLRGAQHSPESAADAIAAIVEAGYVCAKVRGDWSEAAYSSASAAALSAGLSFIGHAPRNLPFSVVVDDGSQKIVHLEELVYTTAALNDWIRAESMFSEDEPLPSSVTAIVDELAQSLAEREIWLVPTQIVIDNYLLRSSPVGMAQLAERSFLPFLDPLERRRWAQATDYSRHLRFRKQVMLQHHMLNQFREAGVNIAAGTDASTDSILNVMPGWSLHEELSIYQSVGFSPYEALRTATVEAARFLGINGGGTIRVGDRADLLILDENPLEHLNAAANPTTVIAGGRWISRAEINANLLDRVRQYQPLANELDRFDEILVAGSPVDWLDAYRAFENPSAELGSYVESVINARGYEELRSGQTELAIETFTLNTGAFPDSANVYDSLAEAWLNQGDKDKAAELYRRALEVDPGFLNAAEMLKELEAEE